MKLRLKLPKAGSFLDAPWPLEHLSRPQLQHRLQAEGIDPATLQDKTIRELRSLYTQALESRKPKLRIRLPK